MVGGKEIYELVLNHLGRGIEVSVYVSESGFFGYNDKIIPPKGHGFEKPITFKWNEDTEEAIRANKLTLRPVIHKKTGEVKAMFVRLDYSYKGRFDGVIYNKSQVWIVAPKEFNMVYKRNPPVSDEPVPERFAKPYSQLKPAIVNEPIFKVLLDMWSKLIRFKKS